MKVIGYIMFFGGALWAAVEIFVAGAQLALWQAKKHGCGDWDTHGHWRWRTK